MDIIAKTKNASIFIASLGACLIFRLLPFRPPNVEPLLAVQMPFARRYGASTAFLFGALSIVLFDILTSGIGPWTLVTAFLYGMLGIFSSLFFKHFTASAKNYALFAFMGVIAYDALSGLTIGPLLFHQSFMVALVGQIPFTLLHLAFAVPFAYFISPLIDYAIVRKREKTPITNLIHQYIS